ncbi:MAG: hypothetical protein ACREQY_21430, partial [Candidatus Binatia bacterium]
YNVGISFPTALGLRDVVLGCIGVESGLRAVSLLAAVEKESVADIRSSLEVGQGIPVATLDAAAAFRHFHEARRRCEGLGRPLPPGYRAAAPYLERPVALPPAGPETEPVDAAPRGAVDGLLDHPAYGSWVFAASEMPSTAAADLAEAMIGDGTGGAGAGSIARRVRSLAIRALTDIEPSDARPRLAAMLRHQASVHALRSEDALAAKATFAAREIEDRGLTGTRFAVRMMERSLRALRAPGARSARPEVRETFKRKLEQNGRPRRREVLVLNLAEALSRQAEDFNESLPPADRLTFEQIERVSLEAAERAATEFTRDTMEQASLPGLESRMIASRVTVRRRLRARPTRLRLEYDLRELLRAETDLEDRRVGRLAAALANVSRWFADEICLGQCREECLIEPGADGRSLFYSPTHPAGLEPAPSLHGPPNFAAAGLGTRRVVGRSIERSIERISDLQKALDGVGFVARGESLSWIRRLGEILKRLRMIRSELSQLSEDPASMYSQIEEVHCLGEDMAAIERRLAVAALSAAPARERVSEPAAATYTASTAARRLERLLRRLGLHEIGPPQLRAALERLHGAAPLLCLLRAAAGPRAP